MDSIIDLIERAGWQNVVWIATGLAALGLANGVRLSLNYCRGKLGRLL